MGKPRGRPPKQAPIIEISNYYDSYEYLKLNGLLEDYYYKNKCYKWYPANNCIYLNGIYICIKNELKYNHS